MARKDIETAKVLEESNAQDVIDSVEADAEEIPVQIISDSEAIHLKLNRIIQLLTQE